MSYRNDKLRGFDLEFYIIMNRGPEEYLCSSTDTSAEDRDEPARISDEIEFGFVSDENGPLIQKPRKVVATGPKADQLDDIVLLLPEQRIGTKEMAADIIRWQNVFAEEAFKNAS